MLLANHPEEVLRLNETKLPEMGGILLVLHKVLYIFLAFCVLNDCPRHKFSRVETAGLSISNYTWKLRFW